MNQCNFVGRVDKIDEKLVNKNNDTFLKFTCALLNRHKPHNPHVIDCVVWNDLANAFETSVTKNKLLSLTCKVNITYFKTDKGKRKNCEFIVTKFDVLE